MLKLDSNGCALTARDKETSDWIVKKFGTNPFHYVLKFWAETSGNQPALRRFNSQGTEIERVSYENIFKNATKFAAYLEEVKKVKKGDPIVLIFLPSTEFATSILGCLLVGAISVPIYPVDPRKVADIIRFKNCIECVKPRFIVTHKPYTNLIGAVYKFTLKAQIKGSKTKGIAPPEWINIEDVNLVETTGKQQLLASQDHLRDSSCSEPLCTPSCFSSSYNSPQWFSINCYSKDISSSFQYITTNNKTIELKWLPSKINLSDIALLQFSSGSTRAPQGIAISYCALFFNMHASLIAMRGGSSAATAPGKMCFDMKTETTDYFFDYALERQKLSMKTSGHHLRLLTWLPLYHDMGLVGTLLGGLLCGQEILMLSPLDFLQRPRVWLELLSQYKCSATVCPNFGLDVVEKRFSSSDIIKLDLTSVLDCGILCGAEPVRAATLIKFLNKFEHAGINEVAINPSYGLAENTLIVTSRGYDGLDAEPTILHIKLESLQPGLQIELIGGPWNLSEYRKLSEGIHKVPKGVFVVGCGKPFMPKMNVIIVDPETLKKLPLGVVGEIWVSSPSGASGYWNKPEDTNRTLFASYIIEDNKKSEPIYIRTGDWGFQLLTEPSPSSCIKPIAHHRLDDDTLSCNCTPQLFITGRLKDTLVIRGQKYHAKDIEEYLEEQYPVILRGGRVVALAIQRNDVENSYMDAHGDGNINDDGDDELLVVLAELKRSFNIRNYSPIDYGSITAQLSKRKRNSKLGCLAINCVRYKRNHTNYEVLKQKLKSDVREFCGINVHEVVFLRQRTLPVTSSGKIRRQIAKDMYLNKRFSNRAYDFLNSQKKRIRQKAIAYSNIAKSKPEGQINNLLSPRNSNDFLEREPSVPAIAEEFSTYDGTSNVKSQSMLPTSSLLTTSAKTVSLRYDLTECFIELNILHPDDRERFLQYGALDMLNIDSFTSFEVIEFLGVRFGIPPERLSPTIFYDYKTIDEVINFIFLYQCKHTNSGQDINSSLPMTPNEKSALSANLFGSNFSTSNTFAIMGIGMRFPINHKPLASASTISDFWNHLILRGRCAVVTTKAPEVFKKDQGSLKLQEEVTASSQKINDSGAAPPPPYMLGCFLSEKDLCPPLQELTSKAKLASISLKISEAEYSSLDPHQILLLAVTLDAIEDNVLERNFGVFVGSSSSNITQGSHQNLKTVSLIDSMGSSSHSNLRSLELTATMSSMLASRLSYTLNLQAPSMVVDTACSSSLVALDVAVKYLTQYPEGINGGLSGAIVAGANLILNQNSSRILNKFGLLAKDGRCKTFDKTADGYGRGEGCCAILITPYKGNDKNHTSLKPLARILSTTTNHDGRTITLTAPSGHAQTQLIRQGIHSSLEVLQKSNKSFTRSLNLQYIECHGSGTQLGDTVELNSLIAALCCKEVKIDNKPDLYLGCVKTNIGHLEGAAGLSGLLNLIFILGSKVVPPLGNFTSINPLIKNLDQINGKIHHAGFNDRNSKEAKKVFNFPYLKTLSNNQGVLGGVSSFGIGGTNAFAVIEGFHCRALNSNNVSSINVAGTPTTSTSSTKRSFSSYFLSSSRTFPSKTECNRTYSHMHEAITEIRHISSFELPPSFPSFQKKSRNASTAYEKNVCVPAKDTHYIISDSKNIERQHQCHMLLHASTSCTFSSAATVAITCEYPLMNLSNKSTSEHSDKALINDTTMPYEDGSHRVLPYIFYDDINNDKPQCCTRKRHCTRSEAELDSQIATTTSSATMQVPDLAQLRQTLETLFLSVLNTPHPTLSSSTPLSPWHWNTSLRDLGLDSLASVEFASQLSNHFHMPFSAVMLYDYPTLNSLISYFQCLEDDSLLLKNNLTLKPKAYAQGFPLAIIATSMRFPGSSNSPKDYWNMLIKQYYHDVEDMANYTLTTIPPLSRWKHLQDWYSDVKTYDQHHYSSSNVNKTTVNHAAFLDSLEAQGLDLDFFKINTLECLSMDPNQSLMLNVGTEAYMRRKIILTNTNDSSVEKYRSVSSMVGVYIGHANSEWSLVAQKTEKFINSSTAPYVTAYTSSGSGPSLIAGRLSYCLNLIGPSLVVDTACSSSLTALNLAANDLRSGIIDEAIIGGTSLMVTPYPFLMLDHSGMLAKDGKSRPFDTGASGYGRGEGCGAIIVTRFNDDTCKYYKDNILAILLGTAVSHDGRNAALTAPNSTMQQQVIKTALQQSRLTPNDITAIETHGTGTTLGDPIEINSIASIFNNGYFKQSQKEEPCSLENKNTSLLYLTGVKGHIGHLEAAAGIAGLIKATLCVHQRKVPYINHLSCLNPHILRLLQQQQNRNSNFNRLRFVVSNAIVRARTKHNNKIKKSLRSDNNSLFSECADDGQGYIELKDFLDDINKPFYMGISSFSYCGTNTHAILSSVVYPQSVVSKHTDSPYNKKYVHAHDCQNTTNTIRTAATIVSSLNQNLLPKDKEVPQHPTDNASDKKFCEIDENVNANYTFSPPSSKDSIRSIPIESCVVTDKFNSNDNDKLLTESMFEVSKEIKKPVSPAGGLHNDQKSLQISHFRESMNINHIKFPVLIIPKTINMTLLLNIHHHLIMSSECYIEDYYSCIKQTVSFYHCEDLFEIFNSIVSETTISPHQTVISNHKHNVTQSTSFNADLLSTSFSTRISLKNEAAGKDWNTHHGGCLVALTVIHALLEFFRKRNGITFFKIYLLTGGALLQEQNELVSSYELDKRMFLNILGNYKNLWLLCKNDVCRKLSNTEKNKDLEKTLGGDINVSMDHDRIFEIDDNDLITMMHVSQGLIPFTLCINENQLLALNSMSNHRNMQTHQQTNNEMSSWEGDMHFFDLLEAYFGKNDMINTFLGPYKTFNTLTLYDTLSYNFPWNKQSHPLIDGCSLLQHVSNHDMQKNNELRPSLCWLFDKHSAQDILLKMYSDHCIGHIGNVMLPAAGIIELLSSLLIRCFNKDKFHYICKIYDIDVLLPLFLKTYTSQPRCLLCLKVEFPTKTGFEIVSKNTDALMYAKFIVFLMDENRTDERKLCEGFGELLQKTQQTLKKHERNTSINSADNKSQQHNILIKKKHILSNDVLFNKLKKYLQQELMIENDFREQDITVLAPNDFYHIMQQYGYFYGLKYQTLNHHIEIHKNCRTAYFSLHINTNVNINYNKPETHCGIDPGLMFLPEFLDGAFQAVGALFFVNTEYAFHRKHHQDSQSILVPIAMQDIQMCHYNNADGMQVYTQRHQETLPYISDHDICIGYVNLYNENQEEEIDSMTKQSSTLFPSKVHINVGICCIHKNQQYCFDTITPTTISNMFKTIASEEGSDIDIRFLLLGTRITLQRIQTTTLQAPLRHTISNRDYMINNMMWKQLLVPFNISKKLTSESHDHQNNNTLIHDHDDDSSHRFVKDKLHLLYIDLENDYDSSTTTNILHSAVASKHLASQIETLCYNFKYQSKETSGDNNGIATSSFTEYWQHISDKFIKEEHSSKDSNYVIIFIVMKQWSATTIQKDKKNDIDTADRIESIWNVTKICQDILKYPLSDCYRNKWGICILSDICCVSGVQGFFRAFQLEISATLGYPIPCCCIDIHKEATITEILLSQILLYTLNTLKDLTSKCNIILPSNALNNQNDTDIKNPARIETLETNIEVFQNEMYCIRLVPIMHPTCCPEFPLDPLTKLPKKCWFIIGGCGALGEHLAEWLLTTVGVSYIILGTSQKNPTNNVKLKSAVLETHRISENFLHQEKAILPSSQQNMPARVIITYCDVTCFKSVKESLEAITLTLGNIDIIIHAAGILNDKSLSMMTQEDFYNVMDVKAKGIEYICESCDVHLQREQQPKLIVAFSSTVSILGNFGQTNYAAANGYLNSFSRQRLKHQCPILCIPWGPWNIGMANNARNIHQRFGVKLLSKNQGCDILALLLGSRFMAMEFNERDTNLKRNKEFWNRCCTITCQDINWDTIDESFIIPPPLFKDNIIKYRKKTQQEQLENNTSILSLNSILLKTKSIHNDNPLALNDVIDDTIKQSLVRILGSNNSSLTIKEDTPILELGLDSLGLVELRHLISKRLGVSMPVTILFEYPTLKLIKDYLIQTLRKTYKLNETSQIHENQDNDSNNNHNDDIRTTNIHTMNDDIIMINKPLHATRNKNQCILITGMACKFPKSDNINEFWLNLMNGIDCISTIPSNRWNIDEFYNENPDIPATMYIKEAGFIRNIEYFDNELFNITKIEASSMDPQQRLFLEVGYTALQDAHLMIESKDIGVFAGVCLPDWTYALNPYQISTYSGTGLVPSLISNRLSYVLGLTGPSFSVDTACSSSLVAVDLAVNKIQQGQCSKAIAGGVQLNLSPFPFIAFCKARMLSKNGRSKTFDASADGYGRGEGCGVIILEKQQHNITKDFWGCIQGIAIGHDGKSANLIAPNSRSQQSVIESAFQNGSIELENISYFETHGTGTPLGDPIETTALLNVFSKASHFSVTLGATKTNIGHLEGAAGIAGLIKTLLVLCHQQIPSVLHIKKLNPLIRLELETHPNSSFKIPQQHNNIHVLKPPNNNNNTNEHHRIPLLGCVSSFGFGGALAHCIISGGEKKTHVLNTTQEKKLIWIFAGQGGTLQFNKICRELYTKYKIFQNILLIISEAVKQWIAPFTDIASMLYSSTNEESDIQKLIRFSQIITFSIEVGIAGILMHEYHLIPDIVIGHSLGEYAAAVISGKLMLYEAASLVAARETSTTVLMNTTQIEEGMVSCFIPQMDNNMISLYDNACDDDVWIAARNTSKNIVFAGKKKALNQFISNKNYTRCIWLPTQRAFHTPLIKDSVEFFQAAAKSILQKKKTDILHNSNKEYNLPWNLKTHKMISFISTVGLPDIDLENMSQLTYWIEHMKAPVNFTHAIETLKMITKKALIMEIGGPYCVLTNLLKHDDDDLSNNDHYILLSSDPWDASTLQLRVQNMMRYLNNNDENEKQQWSNEILNYDKEKKIMINDEISKNKFPLPFFSLNSYSNNNNNSDIIQNCNSIESNKNTSNSNNTTTTTNTMIDTSHDGKNEFLGAETIAALFLETTGVNWKTLKSNDQLKDMGLDSLSAFVFRDTILKRYDIDIPLAYFMSGLLTKKEVEEFLISRLQNKDVSNSSSSHIIETTNKNIITEDIIINHPLTTFIYKSDSPNYGEQCTFLKNDEDYSIKKKNNTKHISNKDNIKEDIRNEMSYGITETLAMNKHIVRAEKNKDFLYHKNSKWLQAISKPPIKIRLFCFPYGGGSTDVFVAWTHLLPSTIELIPVILPGRATHIDEESLDDVYIAAEAFVNATYDILKENIPYAMLGVSVGAIIAYEAIIVLQKRGLKLPVHLFCICCAAPDIYQQTTVKAANIYRRLINKKQFFSKQSLSIKMFHNKRNKYDQDQFTHSYKTSSHLMSLEEIVQLLQQHTTVASKKQKIPTEAEAVVAFPNKIENALEMNPLDCCNQNNLIQHNNTTNYYPVLNYEKNNDLIASVLNTRNNNENHIKIEENEELNKEKKALAQEFLFDFLGAANYRGLHKLRSNPEFATGWALTFANDAAMALKYSGEGRPRISVPITSIEGSYDGVSRATIGSMKRWKKFTTEKFQYVLIHKGDHYLVHGKAQKALKIIVECLNLYISLPSELGMEKHQKEKSQNVMDHWYNRMILGFMKRVIR